MKYKIGDKLIYITREWKQRVQYIREVDGEQFYSGRRCDKNKGMIHTRKFATLKLLKAPEYLLES